MPRLLDTLRHGLGLLGSALVLAVAGMLAACGPGTGGTGTGPGAGASFYSGTLELPPPQTLMPCGTQCGGQAELVIDAQRVELGLPCQRFVYEGSWTFDSGGRAELAGRWTSLVLVDGQAVVQRQDVRLTLQKTSPDAGDARLLLAVSDLNGVMLLGPLGLERQADASPAGSCLESPTSEGTS